MKSSLGPVGLDKVRAGMYCSEPCPGQGEGMTSSVLVLPYGAQEARRPGLCRAGWLFSMPGSGAMLRRCSPSACRPFHWPPGALNMRCWRTMKGTRCQLPLEICRRGITRHSQALSGTRHSQAPTHRLPPLPIRSLVCPSFHSLPCPSFRSLARPSSPVLLQ